MTDKPPARRFLFVTGCPRSGTSALWELLVAHPRVALGVERYAIRAGRPEFIEPALYRPERFFDIQPGDTFYGDLTFGGGVYQGLEARYEQALYWGDKLPMLFRQLPRLQKTFGSSVKVVFIFRNIFDVADSYVRRAESVSDTNWPSHRRTSVAVEEWSSAIAAGLRFARSRGVLLVQYEALFQQGAGLDELFHFLDLDVTPGVRDEFARSLALSAQLEASRKRALNYADLDYITRRAPFADYRRLLARFPIVMA